ncbi:PEP-CTERM sorting domain-containing protein [Tolypothrix campylonemoides VB511288]|nr:PEP-CTERM sorting domain-containing protein [Tolypothrix campylonemoides VB511288]
MTVMRKLTAAMLFGVVISLYPTSKAKAASFSFTKIADTTSSAFSAPFYQFVSPAINNEGTVAFRSISAAGDSIFISNGGTITTIADTSGSFGFLGSFSINNSGTVAFQAGLKGGVVNGVGPGVGIYTNNGGSLTTISFDAGAGSVLVSRPSINDSGTVAFADNRFGDIYIGNGGPPTLIADANGGNPVINNQGTVSVVLPGASLVTRNGGVTTTITDTSGSFASLSGDGSPINNEGTVALRAFLRSGGQGIYTGNGGPLTTIADTSGSFSGFVGTPAINDEATVAFFASLDGGGSGIFTGSDPVVNKIIGTGDTLFGSTVITVGDSNPQTLNNRGQIAFTAALADGTRGVYVATPVPEPLTIAGSGLALAGLVLFKRRQQQNKAN